jgi:3-hydroxy-5-methyl-1-naphthoate 3-O-methyltransferase
VTSLIDRGEVEKLLVIHAGLVSGIVDALASGGPLSAEEVARHISADARACEVLLHALSAVGVAEEPALGRFGLTELGRVHLVDPGPELERHSLLHQVTKLRGWLELPYVIEHGTPPPHRNERDTRTFGRTMAEGGYEAMDRVVNRCLEYARPHPVRRVLDVGGAVGHIALRFARRGSAAVLCDRPAMLEEARRFLGEEPESAAEVTLARCDFNESLPEGPFDIAYLGNVYHIYGPASNRALTRRVFAVLSPGGVIAIRDFVWERSPRAPMFAVNMLQATEEGGVWREAEYRDWLMAAGFTDVMLEDVPHTGNQLLLGRRPER